MARLPTPGSDEGTWGNVLNDFLSQAHHSDGTIRLTSLPDASITPEKLSAEYIRASEKGSANGVATLGLDGKISSGQMPASSGASDATAASKGVIQLTGDLSGTAASPTVPGLASKEPIVSSGTSSQYYRGDKSWQTLNKTAVGLGQVDNTSDANKPVSTYVQTALNAKADDTDTVHKISAETISGTKTFSVSPVVPTPTDALHAATKKYVDDATAGQTTSFSHTIAFVDPVVTNVIIWRATHSCTLANVRAIRTGGTGATVNARKNGTIIHLQTDVSLATTGSFIDGGPIQNGSYTAGDFLEIMVTGIAGSVGQLTVQADFV